CNCFGHSDKCYYDKSVDERKTSLNIHGVYDGGNVCTNCKHHTTGINCEQCDVGYYRPQGVNRDDPNACRKCDCRGLGMSDKCVKDDSFLAEGLKPGDCICKEGFAGENCDRCAPGYKNYPRCEPCYCNYAGSTNADACDGPCVCKTNTYGSRCDRCKEEHYYIYANNPKGCLQCWCAGLTSVCKSSDWGVEVIQSMQNWKVSDLHGRRIANPEAKKDPDRFMIADDVMSGVDVYYWQAPDKYLGNKLNSYGGDLRFTLGYTVLRGDTSGFFTEEADVVLVGGPRNEMIGFNWKRHSKDEQGKTTVTLPFTEHGWYKIGKDKAKLGEVSRDEFALITQDLRRMLIRARFHTDQIEGGLYLVNMEKGVKGSLSDKKMKGMEDCKCPEGYTGPSCLDCEIGWRRVNNTLIGGICVKCDCNNHSESCDPFTGKCSTCLHNTEGDDCGRCKKGFYGNARIGKPDDCKPCRCPLDIPSNNFASHCVATGEGYNDYMCIDCPPGYKGEKCGGCQIGWWGNPMIPGGKCLECDCGPYNNTYVSAICEPTTGRCICKGNTMGPKCIYCLKDHWGDPLKQDCKPCNCNPEGSVTTQCDRRTGQCQCKPPWTGINCYDCSIKHSICRDGICEDGYYGDPMKGEECKACDCDTFGSLSPICDKGTGQCPCKAGTSGRDCRDCPYRHVYTERGCVDCTDGCVNVLLDDLVYLDTILIEIDVGNITELPYTRLWRLKQRTIEITTHLQRYKDLIGRGENVLYNLTYSFDLETLADILYLKARDLETKAPVATTRAIRVGDEAEELRDIIHDLYDVIMKIIEELRRYGMDDGITAFQIDRLLQEAERILLELQRRSFRVTHDEAERELRKARALLERIRQLMRIPGTSPEMLDRLERLKRLTHEITIIVQERVQRPTEQTFAIVEDAKRHYHILVMLVHNSTMYAEAANLSLIEARRLIDLARTEVIDAAVKFGLLPMIKKDLDNLTEVVERHRSILARLNPEYAEKYVHPCQRHVQEMLRTLEQLKGLFFPTKEVSSYYLQAAQAYQRIIDALLAAEEAAKRAYAAAERAYKEAYPRTEDALTKQALRAKLRSYELLEEAKRLRDIKVPELERFLLEKKILLDTIADDLASGERNLELINRALDMLPKGLTKTLKETDIFLRNILESLGDVHQTIDGIEYRIRTELLMKLERLKVGSTSGLENITRMIEKARSDIRDASRIAFNAEEISERVNRRQAQLELNLKELRDKIMLARQKASGIRVSLAADKEGVCIRSFRPEIEPSSTTDIVITYATKDEAKDAMLLFMSSAVNDDFMAIEMIDRKIRFLWNAGGGTQVIEHNLLVETNDQQLSKDTQWYRIEVNKIANVATLNVLRTPDALKVDSNAVTGSSPPGFSMMDFDSKAHFYIGGLPSDFKTPRELRSRSFSGCLSEVILSGKRVPLWNFKTNKGCAGCKQGVSESKDMTVFQFTGESSYAILHQIRRYDKRKYLVGFQFKTFDENALLFMTSSATSGDFVAITLKGGHVVYQFSFGGTATLQLVTKQKYNNGEWVRIAAERDRLEGVLSVEEELLQQEVTAAGLTTLDLSDSKLYFGGVTPNFTTSKWPTISFNHFLGCIKDVQIDTTPLDLLNTDSFGVDHGCQDKAAKVVTFMGNGYLELNGHSLREEADFSFTFKTSQNNALLLLSTYQSQTKGRQRDMHYYSVAVVEGLLEARFNGGAGETTIFSEIRVNDGNYHTVTISKRNRRISLTLDDKDMGASRLAKATKNIEAPEDGGLYIGGIPQGMTTRGMASTKNALTGVIRDFVFNGKQVKLNE
ncbi:Laminin subunit alpha-2-like protein, partial [Leptotrombidium deliense]